MTCTSTVLYNGGMLFGTLEHCVQAIQLLEMYQVLEKKPGTFFFPLHTIACAQALVNVKGAMFV